MQRRAKLDFGTRPSSPAESKKCGHCSDNRVRRNRPIARFCLSDFCDCRPTPATFDPEKG